ncbi:MAG: DMT family transporter [Alphaproteobacteria bacterium]
MESFSDHKKGVIITLVAVLLMTPDGLLVRLVGTDPWTMSFWRGGGMAIMTMLAIMISRRSISLRPYLSLGPIAWIAVVPMTMVPILFINSLEYTSVANVVVIISTAPFLAAVLSMIFLSEKIRNGTWLAIVAAIVGTLIITWGSPEGGAKTGGRIGDLLAVATAFGYAVSLTALRRIENTDRMPAVVVGGLLSATLSFLISAPVQLSDAQTSFAILLCVILLPASRALLVLAPRYLTSPEVSLLLVLETVGTPIWVWYVLGEMPARETFVGGGVIVTAVFVHAWWRLRQSHVPAGPSG